MDENKKNIDSDDEFFIQHLRGARKDPPDFVWSELERKLDQPPGQMFSAPLIWGVAALVALLLALLYFFLASNKAVSSSQNDSVQSTQHDSTTERVVQPDPIQQPIIQKGRTIKDSFRKNTSEEELSSAPIILPADSSGKVPETKAVSETNQASVDTVRAGTESRSDKKGGLRNKYKNSIKKDSSRTLFVR